MLPILGFSKTPILNEAAFLFMRSLFIWISIKFTEERFGPWVFLAFLSFAIVEVIRYPFYLIKLKTGFTKDSKMTIMLGHLRYNLPLVFFPLGALGDGAAGLFALQNIYKQKEWGLYYVIFFCLIIIPAYIFGFPKIYKQVKK